MPFNFTSKPNEPIRNTMEEYGLDDEMDDNVEQVVEDIEENQDFEELSEVEKRLELAHHYRLVLNGRLFNSDAEAALTVEKEVRNFIRSRLEVLVGLKAEKQAPVIQSPFDDNEVKALKLIAERVMKNSSNIDKNQQPTALKQVEVPVKKEEIKLQPRNTISKEVKVEPKVKPAPKAKTKRGRPAKNEKEVFAALTQWKETGNVGDIMEIGGKTWKLMEDPHGAIGADGKVKRIPRDITPKPTSEKALPPLSRDQMTMATQQMAQQFAAEAQTNPLVQLLTNQALSVERIDDSNPSSSFDPNDRP